MSQQLMLPFVHYTSYNPSDFIVGPANGEAYGLLKRWPDWPAQALCVVGPVSSGKTHLLAVYQSFAPTAVRLMPQGLSMDKLRDVFGSAAVLLDDADTVGDQELLLHLINTVKDGKGTLLMTAKTLPSTWGHDLPDLMSRLKSIPCSQLTLPDPFLLRDLMMKLFSDRQIYVEQTVLEMIAARMTRTFDAAHGIVEKLDQKAAQLRKSVSRSLVRDLFNEFPELFLGR